MSPKPVQRTAERRRSPRRPHAIEAWLRSPTASNPADRVEVAAVDISRHGVSFETDRPVAIQAYFVIEIGYGEQKLVCEIRTNNCRALASGAYQIGAEFN